MISSRERNMHYIKILVCTRLRGDTPLGYQYKCLGHRGGGVFTALVWYSVSTVFLAWTHQAAGSMAGNALVIINLFLFIRP